MAVGWRMGIIFFNCVFFTWHCFVDTLLCQILHILYEMFEFNLTFEWGDNWLANMVWKYHFVVGIL
jgi:hypothetical protein